MNHSSARDEAVGSHTTHVVGELCAGCSYCRLTCPFDAISLVRGVAEITDHCADCGRCLQVCPVCAITRRERPRP